MTVIPVEVERYLWIEDEEVRRGVKSFDPSEHPRDSHGRFTEGAGGSSNITGNAIAAGTTPDNYRETWSPTMSPEDGHAWAEAAGTKFPQTVVHMTSAVAVDGIKGQGFHAAEQAVHEAGIYFALRPTDAEFYTYKGSRAVSTVVVTHQPLELDWTEPEKISDAARYGNFRHAALLAAGYDTASPDQAVELRAIFPEGPDTWFEVVEDADLTTTALKAKGYDAVIIRPLYDPETDPTTGGQQIIVFDKEQAVVIGTEEVYYPGVDEAIARAFAKFDEHLHPRDNHGRFAETPGVELPHVTPGQTDAGSENGLRLEDELKRIASSQDQPGWATDEPSVAMKTRNVTEIGSALVERAKSDPKLAAQLKRAGQSVIDTANNAINAAGPGGTLEDYSRTMAGDFSMGYLGDHLSITDSSMSVQEVGARQVAARLQDTWMHSASGSSTMSWGLQLAAGERMGADINEARAFVSLQSMEGAAMWEQAIGASVDDPIENLKFSAHVEAIANSPAVKAYVDEVYSRTQKFLADRGIDEVTLYRGVDLKDTTAPGDTERVVMNPLSSFSTSERTAKTFARHGEGMYEHGAVYRMTVPAARVWSLPTSGPGCLNETEAIVAGGPAIVEVYA